uniref:Reverse transcriptase Ty1/copia-type domain-containing protein n=1 Tax=Fagus sylvatica TaxID=28930 RepID=A0A2N9HQR7_FAGSY
MSTSSTTSPSSSNSPLPSNNQTPIFLLSNISTYVTVKLDHSNFLTWKFQITHILEAYSLLEYVEGYHTCPQKFLVDELGAITTQISSVYSQWQARDKALMSLISATLSPSAHSLVIGQSSSHGMWIVLLKRYTSVSRSNIMNLKKQLHDVKKNTDTIIQYLQRIKEVRDKLAAVGTLIDDEDLLHIVLKGLSSEYEYFSFAMLTKNESVPFEELHVLMITQEELLKSSQANSKENSIMAMAANTVNNSASRGSFHNRGRGYFHNRGRGNNRGGVSWGGYNQSNGGYHQPNGGYNQSPPNFPQSSPNFPQSNPNFSNHNPNRPNCRHPPAKLTAMASATSYSPSTDCWISDTGATDHFTPDLANLPDSSLYNDPQLVSDRLSGKPLYKGLSRDGLYPLHGFSLPLRSSSPSFSPSAQAACLQSIRPTSSLWHARFGHPQDKVLRHLLTNSVSPSVSVDSQFSQPVPPQPESTSALPDSHIPDPQTSSSSFEPPPLIPNTHPMTTRSKSGISKKKILHTTITKPKPNYLQTEPPSLTIASQIPEWAAAMQAEFDALQHQNTCSDGSIARYKARLVAKGFHQQAGLDFDETFSPIVKPPTVRIVLSLAAQNRWSLRQLDISNAFLHGYLKEDVYMVQPLGFVNSASPHHVCKLHKSLYGLKQAPRAWFERFTSHLLTIGFTASTADPSLFVFRNGSTFLYLLLYVDDIILTGNNPAAITSFITALASTFELKDLGPLRYFLGLQIDYGRDFLFVHQRKYITDLLSKFNMTSCKATSTPFPISHKLQASSADLLFDPTPYRSLVGALQYATFTRPDITYAVNQVCQYMHKPTATHLATAKRILRYLQGTLHLGIRFQSGSPTLIAFTDSDWAGDPYDRHSTTGITVFLGNNPITWVSKKQHTVSRSSTEAEYRALATGAAELAWLRQVLCDLGIFLLCPCYLV